MSFPQAVETLKGKTRYEGPEPFKEQSVRFKKALDTLSATLQGADAVVTYAYTRVDARTLDLLVKVDGNVTMRGRLTLSADGRSLTSETPTTRTLYVKR